MKKCFLKGQVKIQHEVQRRPLQVLSIPPPSTWSTCNPHCHIKYLPGTQRTTEATAWMVNFFNLIGDHMPHQMGIHLPSSLTKLSVYQRMQSDMQSRGKASIISKAHFFKLWDEQFSNVKIPKVCQCLHTH